MERITILGTDLHISRLVLGTMTFGSQADEAEARSMVELALDAGITMFDTANKYSDGRSEEILGRVLGSARDEVLIATKAFNPMGDGPHDRGLSAPAIRKAIDASLDRLDTSYVDLYYLHQPDWSVPIDETLGVMNELVEAGKVRHIAVSNYAAWQIADIRCRSEANGWGDVRISQQMYNLLARRVEEEYAAFSADAGMIDIVYNPLAGGLLTGKHRPDRSPAEGTRFTWDLYRDRYWHGEQFEAVRELSKVADDAGLSLIELSLQWLLGRELTDAVVLGASSSDQLEQNLSAADGPALDAETSQRCDQVWERLRGVAPAYNR